MPPFQAHFCVELNDKMVVLIGHSVLFVVIAIHLCFQLMHLLRYTITRKNK